MKTSRHLLVLLLALLVASTIGWTQDRTSDLGEGEGYESVDMGQGRLSPASLDLDTCGCPTTFTDPTCDKQTSWELDKTTTTGELVNPVGEAFLFNVTVTEGPTSTILSGGGQMVITNSGDQTPSLASVAVLLEDQHTGPGKGDAPGPSGKSWDVLASTFEAEASDACATEGAVTCYSDDGFNNSSAGNNLVLFDCENMNDIIALSDGVHIEPSVDDDNDGLRDEDPVLVDPLPNPNANACDVHDNDGDGLYDEDPAEDVIDNDGDGKFDEDPVDGLDNDGDGVIDEDPSEQLDNDNDGALNEDGPDDDEDGAVDEDGACNDPSAVRICFTYEFDITGMGIEGPGDGVVPSDDDLRIDLLVTFQAGGKRGGTCSADVDCDGTDNEHVRTVQQRLRFDPPECGWQCETVTLNDDGAEADTECVDVTSTTLHEEIDATETAGTTTERTVTGEVSCQNCVELPPVPNLDDLATELAPYNNLDGGGGSANITVAYPGGDSYFNTTITNGGAFNQTADGWCIDVNTTISPGTTYCTELISSYDPFADNLVDVPYLGTGERTLDLVNWIINQDFANQAATCVSRNYTFGDIQRAIWDLVNPTSTSGLGTWSQCAADEIRNGALANAGFQPGCDDQVAVILNPCGNTSPNPSPGYQITIYQITLSSVGVACGPPVTECVPCDANVTNTATLECNDGSEGLIEGSPASASFPVTCEGNQPPPPNGPDPGDFCSQTQGGWGSGAAGNNTGTLRDTYFDTVFPGDLIVGDPDGPDADTLYAILLQTSTAVEEYLPAGGTPAALTADQTDPETTSSGVFGGQLTAATLNVAFDAAGLGKCTLTGDCDFAHDPGTLGTLVYGDCVAEGLQGLSVNDVIALANTAISGGGLPAGVSFSDLSDALANLNESFVDCDTVDPDSCLDLP